MKYSKTMLTTLVAAAAMSVPAFALNSATTEYNGVTYSGDIYKITSLGFDSLASSPGDNKTGFAASDAQKYDSTSGEFSGAYGGSSSYSSTAGSTAWLASSDGNACGNTILLSASPDTESSVTYIADWGNYVWIGGLITEGENVSEYSFGRSGLTAIKLSGTADVNMSIGVNTTLLANTSISVESSGSWVVASGKTLTLSSSTGGVSVANGASISVSGGGALAITGNLTLASGTGTITYDGSLANSNMTYSDLSAITTTGNSSLSVSGLMKVASGFTGTVELKNFSSTVNLASLDNYWTSGSTLKLDNITSSYLSSATLAANLEIGSSGLTINNGHSTGSNYSAGIFSGKLTGTGTITFNKFPSNSASQLGGYKFTGDLTGFTGNIAYNQANELAFGAATAAEYASTATATDGKISNIAGTGSIRVSTSAALTFNYAASDNVLALGNSSISASSSTVTFGGGADYLVENSLSASALALSAGTTTLAGTTTVTNAISVSAGAKLGLATQSVSAGSVTFAEGAKLVLANELLASSASLLDVDSAESIALTLLAANSITFNEETLSSDTLSSFTSSYVEFGSAFADYEKAFSYDSGVLSLTLTAIPEPSAFGLLAGVGALALVAARRRRSRAK